MGKPEISAKLVKELREKTNVGMMDCKAALQETEGDIEKAALLLRKKGLSGAKQRQQRTANQGVIDSYLHIGQQIGSLVEINCETDFVARNDEFLELAHQIALHVVACNPQYMDRESVPVDIVESEKVIYRSQCESGGKPEKVWDRIIDGKLDKFYQDTCLMEQPFVKDPSVTVNELLAEASSRVGEKLLVRRFLRFQVGEDTGENCE
ncbi:MAG: translation elongation factor Ts [Actinobacteria bacterium]|nr:translation elongation factor Ts [Actinomycetota bacterium]